MLYELTTIAGTILGTFTREPMALHAAYLASLAPETVEVSCIHLGQSSHVVARVCAGRVFNPSTIRSA